MFADDKTLFNIFDCSLPAHSFQNADRLFNQIYWPSSAFQLKNKNALLHYTQVSFTRSVSLKTGGL